jgi:hypothetical protein
VTGEVTAPFSLVTGGYVTSVLAVKHSAYPVHLNNVIAKRLGISAGD